MKTIRTAFRTTLGLTLLFAAACNASPDSNAQAATGAGGGSCCEAGKDAAKSCCEAGKDAAKKDSACCAEGQKAATVDGKQ
jgi:hypothetical protein